MSGTLTARLSGRRLVYLDTCVFIYVFQRHPQYFPVLRPLLEMVDAGHIIAHSSVMTISEVLVLPFKLGNDGLARDYEERLLANPHIVFHPVDSAVAVKAAQLRASAPGCKLPDAIHLATAIQHGVDAIITNDKRFPQSSTIMTLQLDS